MVAHQNFIPELESDKTVEAIKVEQKVDRS